MWKWCPAAALIVLIATPASAFDGNRKGFVLGGGIGASATSLKYQALVDESEWESKGAMVTDFQIGFGLNDQLLITCFSHVNWYSDVSFWGDATVHDFVHGGGSTTVANGISGVRVSHFLKKMPPCFVITGGVGISNILYPLKENKHIAWGFGIWGGLGYEFSPHWIVAATAGRGTPTYHESDGKLNATVVAVGVTLNYLAY
jgi:hypothetical protein